MDLKEGALVDANSHWYYQAKLVPFKRNLSKFSHGIQRIVDVGAGSGFFARSLADFNGGMTALCIDPNYETETSEHNGALRFVRESNSPFADLYLFVDVLEHVEDDLKLLKMYTTNAPAGALIIITVPAFQSLWSAHDEFLGHFRRYKLKQVQELLIEADLQILQSNYIFGLIFPIAWMVRKLRRSNSPSSDLSTVSRPVNWLLLRLLKIEHLIPFNKIAGLSVFAVAQVPPERH